MISSLVYKLLTALCIHFDVLCNTEIFYCTGPEVIGMFQLTVAHESIIGKCYKLHLRQYKLRSSTWDATDTNVLYGPVMLFSTSNCSVSVDISLAIDSSVYLSNAGICSTLEPPKPFPSIYFPVHLTRNMPPVD